MNEQTSEPLVATIGFLVTPTRVCLAPKLRKVGAGKLNGYGGKKKSNETMFECLLREVSKESGVTFNERDVTKIVTLDFFKEYYHVFRCSIFLIKCWEGIPKATAEMGQPEFHPRKNLPLDRMMCGDRLWVREVMRGLIIPDGGYLIYDRDQTETLFCHLPAST